MIACPPASVPWPESGSEFRDGPSPEARCARMKRERDRALPEDSTHCGAVRAPPAESGTDFHRLQGHCAIAVADLGEPIAVGVTEVTRCAECDQGGSCKRLRGVEVSAGGSFWTYAGHGVEAGGNNYLIPIGAEVESAMDPRSDSQTPTQHPVVSYPLADDRRLRSTGRAGGLVRRERDSAGRGRRLPSRPPSR